MDRDNLNKLKKELLELKRKNIICISKNLFYFIMSCIIIATSSKFSGLGFPYILDKQKKYSIEKLDYNNIDKKIDTKEIRYKLNEELEPYKKDNNTMTIKSKYKLDEQGKYYRNVTIYKLDKIIENPKENTNEYENIINNYDASKNKQDEYIEYSEELNDLWFYNEEVIINYHFIDKNKYIEIKEEEKNNILISIFFSITVFCSANYFISNINGENILNNYRIKDINKKIKQEKSR